MKYVINFMINFGIGFIFVAAFTAMSHFSQVYWVELKFILLSIVSISGMWFIGWVLRDFYKDWKSGKFGKRRLE